MSVTIKELQDLTYSISKQMRTAHQLGPTERLRLNQPVKQGKPWTVTIVRPSGVNTLAPWCDPSEGVGERKPQVRLVLRAVLWTLLATNHTTRTGQVYIR